IERSIIPSSNLKTSEGEYLTIYDLEDETAYEKNLTKNSYKIIDAIQRDFTMKNNPIANEIIETGEIFDYETFFMHKVNDRVFSLPIFQESQGTQKFYDISGLLCMLLYDNRIINIDELESSLHPDLFNHFILTYLVNGKKESQLIATTHNREILNNKDLFRDDAIWFTNKNEDSATELYSLADFDSSVVRDTSNVFNAYKSGKLGGVPNLGDYYIDLEDGE
ncbi:MAG: ATP-binding protein, partial [Chryseobacterium sp.]